MNGEELTKTINELTDKFNKSEISKKEYLKKQIEYMEMALTLKNLSRVKRIYITNALNICKVTLKAMELTGK